LGQKTANARSGSRSPGSRLAGLLLVAVAVLTLAIPVAAEAKKGKGGPKVTVMTRNVFLGTNLRPLTRASSIAEAIDLAGEAWRELLETKFSERVVPLAKEIKQSKADLVGVQELALWRQQTPSDLGAPPTGVGTPATEVREDFLAMLRQELERIGAGYKVVDVQEELDAELPVDVDGSDATGGAFGAELDGRITLHNAILAAKRSRVKLGKTNSATFPTLYEPSIGGPTITVRRGWQSVEAKVKGKKGGKARASKFRFVHAHLEAYDSPPTIRPVQAQELIAGPLNTRKQVILAGDINSGLPGRHSIGPPTTDHPDDPRAFQELVDFGLKDNGAIQTCCGDVRDPNRVLDHTVDHVLTKPGLKTKKAFVTGDDPGERTPSGLWPADHGGVVSRLQLKK
jgi:endonuclease/exonuclease/phosphatase family metal-dependent hydrolase